MRLLLFLFEIVTSFFILPEFFNLSEESPSYQLAVQDPAVALFLQPMDPFFFREDAVLARLVGLSWHAARVLMRADPVSISFIGLLVLHDLRHRLEPN